MTEARNRWAIVAAALSALAAIYVVPLYVPMRPGISEAYMFGFNTRAALVVIFGSIAAFALWTRGLGLSLDVGPSRVSRMWLWLTLLLSSAAMLAAWWAMRRVGPANEGLYFADRYQMFHSGARPYRDFEFAYGPLMFYLPVWIRAVAPISFTNSYYVAGLLDWVAGIVVLWKAVQMAGGDDWLYLLGWAYFAVSVADGAPIYGPLRFAGGMLLALVIQRLLVRRESAVAASAAAALGFVALLSFSPEQGLAFGVATLSYSLLNLRALAKKRHFVAAVGLFVAVAVMALVAADRIGALDTLKSYADGGAALPLVVSPASLIVLLLMMAGACVAWGTLRSGVRQHPLLYVLLVSICTAPAAFSRCFPAALVGNMTGASIVGLIVLTRYKWPGRVAACGFLLVVGVAARDQIRLSSPLLRAALTVTSAPTPGSVFSQSRPLLAPFGWDQRTFEAGGDRILSGRYAYYQPLLNSQVPAAKIDELKANPNLDLLLPNDIASNCEQAAPERRTRLKSMLNAVYLQRAMHRVTAGQPLCDYIKARYRPSAQPSPDGNYTLWTRR